MKHTYLPCVHDQHGSWYLVKKNKWTHLCRKDDGEEALLEAYSRIRRLPPPKTLREIFPLYLQSAAARVEAGKMSPATLKNYARVLSIDPAKPGILTAVFGAGGPDDFQPTHMKQFLVKREESGVATSGNREMAALSSVYEYAMGKGWATCNPCRGVRRNTEHPAKNYTTHAQLKDGYARAHESLQYLINFEYLSGMRLTDAMRLKRSQIVLKQKQRESEADKYFIDWSESKTGKDNMMEIGPLLMTVIARAIAYGDAVTSKITAKLREMRPTPMHVFVNSRGQPWTQAAVSSAMARADVGFTIRSLRPKAQTDAQHRNVLGHEGQMRQVYIRKRQLQSVG